MTNNADRVTKTAAVPTTGPPRRFRNRLVERHRWLPLVAPLAVYLAFGLLEPAAPPHQPPPQTAATHDSNTPATASTTSTPSNRPSAVSLTYPIVYTIKFFATLAVVLFFAPVYRVGSWRVSVVAVTVGLIGGGVWIVLAKWELVTRALTAAGLANWASAGARPAFDPLAAFTTTWQLSAFLLVRFGGLVLLVPLIEEFFLRGFLMRFVTRPDWWQAPLGDVTLFSAATATVYGIAAHPAEPLAAAVWFTGITMLYQRTRNIWDCVIAHAATNLLLGIYIVVWRDWCLW